MSFMCPSDCAETAEAYCLGHLSRLGAEMFEQHFFACQKCAEEVERTETFVRSIRAAGMEMFRCPPKLIQ